MVAHAAHKMLWLKALADDVIQDEEDVARLAAQNMVNDLEIIVVIQHVQVVDDILVGDVFPRKTHHLVEDGKRIAQGTVGFLSDNVKGFWFSVDAFALGNVCQMLGDIVNRNPFEVKDLAT